MDRVGVRELRQNLSVYLRRVKAGESLEVTEHGRLVAVLAPPAPAGNPIARLIAEGRARAAVGTIDDIPVPPGPPSYAGTKALMEDREGKE
ncbi:MAG: type II toxin-antitoxin system prevent-host-death family antitoxin [Actinobacteria bacterium]|nr:type II toxin-antitoxin system prevent-host-death family antitoxin [Actinomycetota bacterium]